MTQNQIIELAREADLQLAPWDTQSPVFVVDTIDLQRFAAIVAAHEREQCALVCDEQVKRSLAAAEKAKSSRDEGIYKTAAQTSIWNAAAIRARGEK